MSTLVIQQEVEVLQRFSMNVVYGGGDKQPYIYVGPVFGTVRVDMYDMFRDQAGIGRDNEWHIDDHDAQQVVLYFTNRAEFRRAYRLARLLRGAFTNRRL